MRELRLFPLWLSIGFALVALVLYFCLRPRSEDLFSLLPDKFSHVVAFFALTVWFAAFVERRRYLVVALGMLVLGMVIELLQQAMGLGRSAEVADVYADALGVGLGIAASLVIRESWLQRVERWLSI